MSAFVVKCKLLTDENDIRNMWADHFEALGTPPANTSFDDELTFPEFHFKTEAKVDFPSACI